MNLISKSISAIVLTVSAATAFAAPEYLVTHNKTDVESNAFIGGTIPSPYPTAAHSTNKVYWNMVRFACYGHTTSDNKCSALIKMATNTANPIDIGWVTMDINTGEINPKSFSGNGYTFTINGIAEGTITKD